MMSRGSRPYKLSTTGWPAVTATEMLRQDIVSVQLELVEASRRRYQKAAITGSQKGEAMLQVRSSS